MVGHLDDEQPGQAPELHVQVVRLGDLARGAGPDHAVVRRGSGAEQGVPVIDGALAWVVCSLRELIAGGDHTIAIGEVVAIDVGEGDPLVWYGRQYHDVRLRVER